MFITAVFYLANDLACDLTRSSRLRWRGPQPVLANSELLTIETVGEFLDTDQALHAYFRRRFATSFPDLRTVHRTTLARHTANLWLDKIAFWQCIAVMTRYGRESGLINSLPVPVCRLTHAFRCWSFRGVAPSGATRSCTRPIMGCVGIYASHGPA